VRTIIEGEERSYGPGDVFDVPAGAAHQMTADPPARVTWEVRPALNTAEFFETLYSGEIPPDFLERFSAEIRFV
jgi:quercetin dioxygenase-like cupin family protein